MTTNDDFIPGMKVSLNGEFGVVVKTENLNQFGIIRWDNSKEKDFEDWTGQFGSFLQIGGKIINDYEFNFINVDGSLKHKI